MSQFYFEPDLFEIDPHQLPGGETFLIDDRGYLDGEPFVLPHEPGDVAYGLAEPGWYWWACFPGCLPDGDPVGPFATEDEAIADAREERQ